MNKAHIIHIENGITINTTLTNVYTINDKDSHIEIKYFNDHQELIVWSINKRNWISVAMTCPKMAQP